VHLGEHFGDFDATLQHELTSAPSMSWPRAAISACLTVVKNNPRLLGAVSGGTLCLASDAGAQQIERRSALVLDDSDADGEPLVVNLRRLAASGLIGAFFGSAVYPLAYARLDAMFRGNGFAAVLTKSVVEIFTVGLFVNSVSLSARGAFAGHSPEEIARHVRGEMPKVTVNDARVWLPYNFLAFTYVPIWARPTTTALMEASWQTYISLRAHAYARPALKGSPALSTAPL
jgi:hypothetical protein